MCGIFGFSQHPATPTEEAGYILDRMAQSLRHRGPDGSGQWLDDRNGIAFGHNRLSIIDLSDNGKQPMTSEDGCYVITFNGEIYNFRTIKTLLRNTPITWRGESDTEVLLAAIATWGLEKALTHCVGMFAFALWDKKQRQLYLIRDRIGVKPLYYGIIPSGVVFGSELKALFCHPALTKRINTDILPAFLRYNYVPCPHSIYHDVFKLEPGHYLAIPIDRLGDPLAWRKVRYWRAQPDDEQTCAQQANHQTIASTLDLAVQERIYADVPVGAFLSGGIDSTLIAALMRKHHDKPKTFSIGFYDKKYDEAEYARAVAKHLGTEHIDLYVTPKQALDVIPNLPHLYDEPFADSSQIPTFLVCQLAKQYVTVCLTGDGADELFGGYNRYLWADNIYRKIRRLPKWLRALAPHLIAAGSPQQWDWLLGLLGKCHITKSHRLIGEKLYKIKTLFNAENEWECYERLVSIWQTPGDALIASGSPPSTSFFSGDDFKADMMRQDFMTYLPDDILTKVDRASMGVSLEARNPFLDHRLVELAMRLPMHDKIRGDTGKWVLREMLYQHVPKALLDRPKMGFGVPIDQWLRGPLLDWAESLLDHYAMQCDGFFNHDHINRIWREHKSGKRNWQHQLWGVLMFQAWKNTYLNDDQSLSNH